MWGPPPEPPTLFVGLLCHLDDACVSNPCHEDAVCDTNPVNGRAICTCPPGFTGGACDQDVDECSIGGWGEHPWVGGTHMRGRFVCGEHLQDEWGAPMGWRVLRGGGHPWVGVRPRVGGGTHGWGTPT